MYRDEIYDAASAVTGTKSDMLLALCIIAEAELESRLKRGIEKESCRDQFINAAALLAAGSFIVLEDSGDNVESYSAGSVSIKKRGAAHTAYLNLREQAETIMSPYIDDAGFSFVGVRG